MEIRGTGVRACPRAFPRRFDRSVLFAIVGN